MSTSWINYVYKQFTGEEDNERATSSLDVLSKANIWFSDLPTNNLGPIEESFGARKMTKKGNKDKELEEKMAVLEQQYQEREKELLKRNSALENQLKESRDKMDDLRIQHEKENESLQTEIKDLKDTLLTREKCHTRQKDLLKKMAANAQSELDKARVVISNLSEGIKACEATLSASKETISEKDQKIKQLTSQLNKYEDLLKKLTVDTRNYHKSLQKAANDVDKISERLEVSLEVNSKLVEKISFLQDEDKKMQFDLQERRNKERLNDKMGMMNHLKEDLKTKRTDVTVEILGGVYDDLQPTELNVKSGDCFLPEQKSTVLTKETETPKGDEANVKKTVKDKGGPIRHHQSPLPPIFARLSTSEVGRAKKDDDWLVRNQGNFLPFSQKGK
nr:centromere protein F-like [Pocillopora verrucosa]